MKIAAVILAAGQGTRMKSSLAKVLHPLAGKPMVFYAVQAVQAVCETKPVLVVGVGAEQVQAALGQQVRYVTQGEQLGTGHAVLQTRPVLSGESELVLVTCADMPLLRGETLQRLVAQHQHNSPTITVLTVMRDDARGFGRVLRAASGAVTAIVEKADATPEQLAIRELNTATYCFDASWLWSHLDQIPKSPKGEYYLTDLVGMAVDEGCKVETLTTDEVSEALGINTRVHLAEAESVMRRRINEKWMLGGVTIVDPATTYIEAGVTLGADTVVYPNTFLQGETRIGATCRIGPNTIIRDSVLGDGCVVLASVVEGATLEDEVDIGPFGHLRKGAYLATGVHMGNFGEVKNSYLGPGVKMGHFSYLGDATVGADANIGAGTITCNYDGERKHPTEIGEGVFIGSDTMLVAPVQVGKGAKTGAGAVVTRDVPPDSLAFGVPARVKHSVLRDADAKPVAESKDGQEKE
jgi:bifunctional UDP-N-acetylglucosamine pyrophosphorylase/glucosamine-1-phosphate N-acetyltransferase